MHGTVRGIRDLTLKQEDMSSVLVGLTVYRGRNTIVKKSQSQHLITNCDRFALVTVTISHRLGGLNHRHLVFHSFRVWKSKIKGPEGWLLETALLLGCK